MGSNQSLDCSTRTSLPGSFSDNNYYSSSGSNCNYNNSNINSIREKGKESEGSYILTHSSVKDVSQNVHNNNNKINIFENNNSFTGVQSRSIVNNNIKSNSVGIIDSNNSSCGGICSGGSGSIKNKNNFVSIDNSGIINNNNNNSCYEEGGACNFNNCNSGRRSSTYQDKLLTASQQASLQRSWDIISTLPGGHRACIQSFYRLMLTKGSDHVRQMFAFTNMHKQEHMLTSVVKWALRNNFDGEAITHLAVLHSHLGVTPGDLQLFYECFMSTLSSVMGPNLWEDSFEKAWSSVFDNIKQVMIPAIEEIDKEIETVTKSDIESSETAKAHGRLTRWFKKSIVVKSDGSVVLVRRNSQFSSISSPLSTVVDYALALAPLIVPFEYSKRSLVLHGRILYINNPDNSPGGFIDMCTVSELTLNSSEDGDKFFVTIHVKGTVHFLRFDSETIAERWNIALSKNMKQFSCKIPSLSTPEVKRLIRSFFSGNKRLVFRPGDFNYLTLIGKGSFGKVVKVQHKGTQKIYAMKIIQKSSFVSIRNVIEVRRERAILEVVDSPFIVKFHGFFQSEDRLYFLFDFLSGGELFYHTKCAENHHFSEEACRFYTAEISCALEHLRQKNIVHRDIKGDNFVLDAKGHVVLTDFGFAKAIDKSKKNTATCGTLAYIAPEILAPSPEGYGYEVDWWSLGVVLFTMLTGFFPFLRPTPPETAKAIVYEPLRFPSSIPTTHNARSLCRNLMHKNPKQRITSLGALQAHPFFAGFDWTLLFERKMTPPFVPDTSGANTKYFSAKLTHNVNKEELVPYSSSSFLLNKNDEITHLKGTCAADNTHDDKTMNNNNNTAVLPPSYPGNVPSMAPLTSEAGAPPVVSLPSSSLTPSSAYSVSNKTSSPDSPENFFGLSNDKIPREKDVFSSFFYEHEMLASEANSLSRKIKPNFSKSNRVRTNNNNTNSIIPSNNNNNINVNSLIINDNNNIFNNNNIIKDNGIK